MINKNNDFLAVILLVSVFILLTNVEMSIIVGILTYMSGVIFVLSRAEHEKSFITSGPDQDSVIITK